MSVLRLHLPPALANLLGSRPGQEDGDGNLLINYPMTPGETLAGLAANLHIPLAELLLSNPDLGASTPLSNGLTLSLPPQYLSTMTSNAQGYVAPLSSSNGAMPSGSTATALGTDDNPLADLVQNVLGIGSSHGNPLASLLGLDPTTSMPIGQGGSYDWADVVAQMTQSVYAPFAAATSLLAPTEEMASYAPFFATQALLSARGEAAAGPNPFAAASSAPLGFSEASVALTTSSLQAAAIEENTLAGSARVTAATSGVAISAAMEGEATSPTSSATYAAAERASQSQRAPELPLPPPLGGDPRANPFAQETAPPSALVLPATPPGWSVVVVSNSYANQAKLEIMALLAAPLGPLAVAAGAGGGMAGAQAPGFVDPQAAAAYAAAAMQGGRSINLGMGRSLQFSLVDDRLRRVGAIGEDERGAGSRRTGDGLDEAARVDPAERDEEARGDRGGDDQERRRLAAVAAMRRRQRPRSTRCRYRHGPRRPLRATGSGRYPSGVDLREFSERLPPRYLWTATPPSPGAPPA